MFSLIEKAVTCLHPEAGYRKTIVKKKNLLSPFSDAFHRFDAVFPFTEGGKA